MNLQSVLGSASETAVVYRYLDLLAARSSALERSMNLNEVHRLQQENRQLREELARVQKPSIQQLLVFLPLIYRNFWGTVRPHDLALLAGELDVPQIPSPCPEPGSETLSRLRREFLALPATEQLRLVIFCQGLPYPLTVRPEMRAFLEKKNEV